MAKKSEAAPFAVYLEGTGDVFDGFTRKAVEFSPADGIAVIQILTQTIKSSLRFLISRLPDIVEGAADEVVEMLEALGAVALIEQLGEALDKATTPLDLAAVGTVLPLIKKIIRFVVQISERELPFDLDKILEFVDELATTIMDLISPKGAEAMHRAEIRFLEAQIQLDRLTAIRHHPMDINSG